jgi:hypothetical protein
LDCESFARAGEASPLVAAGCAGRDDEPEEVGRAEPLAGAEEDEGVGVAAGALLAGRLERTLSTTRRTAGGEVGVAATAGWYGDATAGPVPAGARPAVRLGETLPETPPLGAAAIALAVAAGSRHTAAGGDPLVERVGRASLPSVARRAERVTAPAAGSRQVVPAPGAATTAAARGS